MTNVVDQVHGDRWALYCGDNIDAIKEIPDNSVGLTVSSPPFPGMYSYTNSPRDMGNVTNQSEMVRHFGFLIPELLRVTKPGRHCALHLCQGVAFKGVDGYIGLKDFRGEIIRAMEAGGWIYYGEVCIDKDPQVKAIRTKDRGLLFKTLANDSSHMHMALADYLLQFRKPGDNAEPIRAGISQKYENYSGWITQEEWIEWAAPVWYRATPDYPGGIRETDVLNVAVARDSDDERHLCLARGSLVLTRQHGYMPIEDVQVGDLVLTHQGRWQPVTAKQCNGTASTIRVCAQGVADLRVTPNHELWTKEGHGPRAKAQAASADPAWVRAENTLGSYLNLKLPPVEDDPLTADEWWIVGRWLADGHRNGHPRSGKRGGVGQFLLSCARDKAPSLIERLGKHAGHAFTNTTATQIALVNLRRDMRDVLDRCGRGAANKHLPGEAASLSPEKAESLLAGYLSADGHYVDQYDRWTASSVSRALLLGMALLAQRARGVVASVYAGRPEGESVIEGRPVHTQQDWVFGFRNSRGYRQSGWIADDGAWKKVRTIEPGEDVEVWDLAVAGDASFTAEGAIVHNCPLQLGVIERAVKLWSAPGDVVLDPFNGIGSTGVRSLELGRRYIGFELKPSYYATAVGNLTRAESSTQGSLFSMLGASA